MTPSDQAQHDQFLRLFLEHEPSLRVFVRSLLFSNEEQREVMQEVALVLWRKFDPTLSSASFCRWAFGVARLESLVFRRDRARDRHTFGDDVYELLADTIHDQAEHLEAERRALELCLQRLPEDRRRVVQAVYLSGSKVEQLASQLGSSVMALYKTLHRSRLLLMECTKGVLLREETL